MLVARQISAVSHCSITAYWKMESPLCINCRATKQITKGNSNTRLLWQRKLRSLLEEYTGIPLLPNVSHYSHTEDINFGVLCVWIVGKHHKQVINLLVKYGRGLHYQQFYVLTVNERGMRCMKINFIYYFCNLKKQLFSTRSHFLYR